VASGVTELFLLFSFQKMNEREVATAAYDRASTALAETQKKLNKAEEVVAEWDDTGKTFKNKTLEEWKLEVEKLEKQKEKDEQEVKEARASFDRVVQGNSFSLIVGPTQAQGIYIANLKAPRNWIPSLNILKGSSWTISCSVRNPIRATMVLSNWMLTISTI
jgi:hypothetical protein